MLHISCFLVLFFLIFIVLELGVHCYLVFFLLRNNWKVKWSHLWLWLTTLLLIVEGWSDCRPLFLGFNSLITEVPIICSADQWTSFYMRVKYVFYFHSLKLHARNLRFSLIPPLLKERSLVVTLFFFFIDIS